MGFSVWESQLEKEHGRGVTPKDMQLGVQNAAVVVLLLTPGIFHAERIFVFLNFVIQLINGILLLHFVFVGGVHHCTQLQRRRSNRI